MDFPITDLMDEQACYDWLVRILHPDGLSCPRYRRREGLKVHRRYRAPVLDYRCSAWRRVFNAFTETVFHNTRVLSVASQNPCANLPPNFCKYPPASQCE